MTSTPLRFHDRPFSRGVVFAFAPLLTILSVGCAEPSAGDDAGQSEQAVFDESIRPGGAVAVTSVHSQRVTLLADPGDLVEIVATGDTWSPVVDSYEGASREWMHWEDVSKKTVEGNTLRFLVRMRWPVTKMVFRHGPDDATRGNLSVTAKLVESGASLMAMFDASPCAAAPPLTDAAARLAGSDAVALGSARVLKRKMYCGNTCDGWAFGALSTYNGNDVWWLAGGASHSLGGPTRSVLLRLRRDGAGAPSLDVEEDGGSAPIWRCRLADERCVAQNTMYLPWGNGTIKPGDQQPAQIRSGCFYLKMSGGNAIHSYNALNPNPYDRGELVVTGTF